MTRLIKKPVKKIRLLCRKLHIKITRKTKKGSRVYKTKTVLMKQIKRKQKSLKMKFGDCGCAKKSYFGKKTRSFGKKTRKTRFGNLCAKPQQFGKHGKIRKLHKLCKMYKVK